MHRWLASMLDAGDCLGLGWCATLSPDGIGYEPDLSLVELVSLSIYRFLLTLGELSIASGLAR